MEILKENEITIYNDIYFLKIVKNKIVVNNNYEGILILNSDLSVIKKIDIYQDFCIYNAIVLNNNEVLFNCVENNYIFVVNIETSEIKKCEISEMIENEILMKKIMMESNHVIVKSYKNNFWNFDLNKMIFHQCTNSIVEENEELDDKSCTCIDHIQVDNSLIHMNELNLLICKDEYKHNILPQKGYRFLGIGAIHDNHSNKLIVLSGSNDNEISVLTSYCIK